MGYLLVGDLTLYSLALALLAGVLFLLLSLRLRQIYESTTAIARSLRRVEEQLERFDERVASLEGIAMLKAERGNREEDAAALAERVLERLDALQPRGDTEEEPGVPGLIETIRGEMSEHLSSLGGTLDEQIDIIRGSVRSVVQEELHAASQFPFRIAAIDPQEVARAFLDAEGFERIAILAGESDREVDDLMRLTVEAVREDVVHKGAVTIHGGEVIDVELRPTYPMFP